MTESWLLATPQSVPFRNSLPERVKAGMQLQLPFHFASLGQGLPEGGRQHLRFGCLASLKQGENQEARHNSNCAWFPNNLKH